MTGSRKRVALAVAFVVLLAALYGAQAALTALQEAGPSGAPPLPTMESAAQLMLVGFRAMVVDVFWMQASNLQEKGRLDEAVAKYGQITRLQPDLADVWHYLIWNIMYNLPYEVEAVEDKWNLIKLGVEYTEVAAKRVPDNGYFDKDIGFMLWHRFDDRTFGEAEYLRRKFLETKGRTNFDAAIEWLEKAVVSKEFEELGEGAKDIWRRQITHTLDRWTTQAFVDGDLPTARSVAGRAIEKWQWAAQFNPSHDPKLDINLDRMKEARKRLQAVERFIESKEASDAGRVDDAIRQAEESVDAWQWLVDAWPSGPDLPGLQKAAAWLERLRVDKKAKDEKKP
ncbi:MAG: hypothetical protein AB1696_03060 [Planctomycetota bacterium]